MSDDSTPQTASGARLRQLRLAAGLSTADVARRVGASRRLIRRYETGRVPVPLAIRERLAGAFGVPVGDLVAARIPAPVSVEGGTVAVGTCRRRVAATQPTSDEVLDGYLHLVYQLRGLKPGDPLPLRDEDVDRLAEALGDDHDTIEARLMELIDCSADEARHLRKMLLRRRVMVPAAGMALGMAGFSATSLADALDRSDPPDTPASTTTTEAVPTTTTTEAAPTTTVSPAAVPTTAATGGQPAPPSTTEPPPEIGEPLVIERDDVTAEDPEDDWAEIGEPLVIERDVADIPVEEPAVAPPEIGEALVIERDPSELADGGTSA